MASGKSLIDSHIQLFDGKVMRCIRTCFDSVVEVGNDISDICTENEELKLSTKELMRNFVEMDYDAQHHLESLKHINSMTTNDGSAIDYPEEFNRQLSRSRSDGKDYQSHPKYKDLEDCLTDAGSLEEQIAALRDKLTITNSNDDIVVTEEEINTKCPITGKTLVFPMRNKLCKHVYDKAGITSYITSRKAKAKCPAVGCGNRNPITVDVLEEHPDLRKYIQLLNKLQGLKVKEDLSETL